MSTRYGCITEIEFYKSRVWVRCISPDFCRWGIILERVEITDEVQVGDAFSAKNQDHVLWTSARYPSECSGIHIPVIKLSVDRPIFWKRFLMRHFKNPKLWMQ